MNHLFEIILKEKIQIKKTKNIASLNLIRIKLLGKNGHITQETKKLHTLPKEKRQKIGKVLNRLKKEIQNLLKTQKKIIENFEIKNVLNDKNIDISLPGRHCEIGSFHPITRTINIIKKFFKNLGCSIFHGPEIENDYYNFDALNIPNYHPARTSHNTFWINNTCLLRTQTSSVQIRIMKNKKPPIRIISPGKVYRNDYNQTHTPMFHQIEGLFIDENLNFSSLKSILHNFLNYFFEKKLNVRFRPSYFPFTKISAEIDIMNENKEWIEVLGCGIVHPKILSNLNINYKKYLGLAFGMGIERLAMLKYRIFDLRQFFENDLRFLKQFE